MDYLSPVFWGLVCALPLFVFMMSVFLLLNKFNLFGFFSESRGKLMEEAASKTLLVLMCYSVVLLFYFCYGFMAIFVHLFMMVFHFLFVFMALYSLQDTYFMGMTSASSMKRWLVLSFWIFLWSVSLSQSMIFFGFISPTVLIMITKFIGLGILLYFLVRWYENEEEEGKKYK